MCINRPLAVTRTGMMMTIPLYSYKPQQFQFFQAVNGIQMWRHGASNKVCVYIFQPVHLFLCVVWD